ncbi:MAG: hypothetical protein IT437_07000 [Phycisphaerales bacterium]|nr:hypothetical protein [Phycisphaerales bacterium]
MRPRARPPAGARAGRVRRVHVLIVAVAVVAASVVYYRAARSDAGRDLEFERGREAHQASLASLAMRPASDPQELESRISGARQSGPVPASREQSEKLQRVVAEFLALCSREAPADEIGAWRRSRGYGLRPDKELSEFGADPAAGPPEDVWRKYLATCRESLGSAGVPATFPSSPDGYLVAFSQATRTNIAGAPPRLGIASPLAFVGSATSSPSVWVHPESLEAQLSSADQALCAWVCTAAEFGDGRRRPVALKLTWAPRQRDWVLESVTTGEQPPIGWGY